MENGPESVKELEKEVVSSKIKPFLGINIEKGDRRYSFNMELGSPIGEAYDAAFAVLAELLEMSKKAAANAKPKEEEKAEEKI